jgi:anthranilate phosphoribosyltransferase
MLTGAAKAMRDEVVKIDLEGLDPVDVVGTGGDGAGTFNVSTTAAFIAAGAGVPVAKHGNVASTSACGSADVLRALGYNLSAAPETVARCVREVGIGFLFARELHPAMRFAAPVRKKLGFRTVFNLLGPLTNPARTRRQVIGVPQEKLAMVFAETFRRLGSVRSMIVCGDGGLDEISPGGFTFVSSLDGGAVRNSLLDAGTEYGERYPVSAIVGGDAAANAKLLLSVLGGEERGPYRAAAVENAAAAILVGGKAVNYKEALSVAAESVDSGNALAKLKALVAAAK